MNNRYLIYRIAQMWFFSHNKVVAAGQGVLVVMYIPAGIGRERDSRNSLRIKLKQPFACSFHRSDLE